jgi:branched-chain amino acid transport system ATP-binding protein
VLAAYDLSFDLKQGEFVGVIGPNGSGKTTLVNLITGFVKPDSGKVLFKGKNITGKMPYTIAGLGISRTFQMVRLFYNLPAYKNLIIPLCSSDPRNSGGANTANGTTWPLTCWMTWDSKETLRFPIRQRAVSLTGT